MRERARETPADAFRRLQETARRAMAMKMTVEFPTDVDGDG
jgi:hypothetical protein